MTSVGTLVDRKYRIERELGAGGMGVVFAATHLHLHTKVAIKMLKAELASQPAFAQRFMREARTAVQLTSEHVCKVIDVGETIEGQPYMVMELLAGTDLGKLVEHAPLGVAVAADYVTQACSAIAEAHALGMVHRDLKPANLFLAERPAAPSIIKVLDFGIVKVTEPELAESLTHTTMTMGSPHYMSPEQLESAKHVDARTDVWSLGVTLYQLVSARLPFPGDTLSGVSIAIAMKPHRPLDNVPPEFAAVVDRCLAKQAQDRYRSTTELAAALARFRMTTIATQGPMIAMPVAIGPRRGAGRPWVVAAGVVAAVAALVLLLRSHAAPPIAAYDAAPMRAAEPDAIVAVDAPADASVKPLIVLSDAAVLPRRQKPSAPPAAADYDYEALLPCRASVTMGSDAPLDCSAYQKQGFVDYGCGSDNICHARCPGGTCGDGVCERDGLCHVRHKK